MDMVDVSPLELLPSIFENFSMDDNACKLERKLENDDWKCSSFKNSYGMYYCLIGFGVICIVKVLFLRCVKKGVKGKEGEGNDDEIMGKKELNLKELFSEKIKNIFTFKIFVLLILIMQGDLVIASAVAMLYTGS